MRLFAPPAGGRETPVLPSAPVPRQSSGTKAPDGEKTPIPTVSGAFKDAMSDFSELIVPSRHKKKTEMYIDTHSHIYAEEFDDDREEAIGRAFEAGVERLVLPDIDRASRPRMMEAAARHPGRLFPTLGVHPTSVDGSWREEMAAFEKWLGRTEIVAIGECGIDLHWDTTYYKEQRAVFERQLRVAGEMDLPVIIHSRDSLPEIFDILKRQRRAMKGVLHCFPGTAEDAARAADLGFLLGIGGVVTFKRSGMAETVRQAGASRLVLETDCPYLAPAPHRGKRNESGYIPLIAAKIAEILGEDIKKIAETTTNNAMKLFNLPCQNLSDKDIKQVAK